MPPPPFLKQGRGAYWGRHSVSAALSLIAKTQRLGYSALKPWIVFKWIKITKSNGGTAINWNHIGPSLDFLLKPTKANIEEWQLVCTVAHPFAQNERILKLASIFERSWTFLIRKHLMICHLQDMKSVKTWKIWGSKWLQGSPPNFREMQVPWMNMAHFGCPGQDPLELSPKYLTLNQILCKITHFFIQSFRKNLLFYWWLWNEIWYFPKSWNLQDSITAMTLDDGKRWALPQLLELALAPDFPHRAFCTFFNIRAKLTSV